jgi:hypothetical protein
MTRMQVINERGEWEGRDPSSLGETGEGARNGMRKDRSSEARGRNAQPGKGRGDSERGEERTSPVSRDVATVVLTMSSGRCSGMQRGNMSSVGNDGEVWVTWTPGMGRR